PAAGVDHCLVCAARRRDAEDRCGLHLVRERPPRLELDHHALGGIAGREAIHPHLPRLPIRMGGTEVPRRPQAALLEELGERLPPGATPCSHSTPIITRARRRRREWRAYSGLGRRTENSCGSGSISGSAAVAPGSRSCWGWLSLRPIRSSSWAMRCF